MIKVKGMLGKNITYEIDGETVKGVIDNVKELIATASAETQKVEEAQAKEAAKKNVEGI